MQVSSLGYTRKFFTTAVVAVVLKGFITYCESGKYGLFGNGGLIMFDVSSVTFKYQFVDPVLILGIIGGIVGAVYNYLLEKTLRLYALINRKEPISNILLACVVFIFTSCCNFWTSMACKMQALSASENDQRRMS
jgi:chloride channel 7